MAKDQPDKRFPMQRGDLTTHFAARFDSETPIAQMVGRGSDAYLWIGGRDGPCYATLEGKSLRGLRDAITQALRGR